MSTASDNRRLSAKRRQRPRIPRSDDDVLGAALRLIQAVGERATTADPDSSRALRLLELQVEEAWDQSVDGWRATGFSDGGIGSELGVSKQAVQQRWPRERRNDEPL